MCVRDNMLERHNEPRAERSTYEFADLAELLRISYILRENSFSSIANKKYPIFKARLYIQKSQERTPRSYFIPVVCCGKLPIH